MVTEAVTESPYCTESGLMVTVPVTVALLIVKLAVWYVIA